MSHVVREVGGWMSIGELRRQCKVMLGGDTSSIIDISNYVHAYFLFVTEVKSVAVDPIVLVHRRAGKRRGVLVWEP